MSVEDLGGELTKQAAEHGGRYILGGGLVASGLFGFLGVALFNAVAADCAKPDAFGRPTGGINIDGTGQTVTSSGICQRTWEAGPLTFSSGAQLGLALAGLVLIAALGYWGWAGSRS